MAKYNKDGYTEKQEAVLTRLTVQAAKYKRRITELNDKMRNNPTMLFDEAQRVKEMIKRLEDQYKETSKKIENVMGQRDAMEKHLASAQKHLDAAEKIKEEWGFR